MSNTIVEELKNTIEKINLIVGDDKSMKNLERANEEYKEMVKNGVIKSRGYNLLSFDDKHLHKADYSINS